MTEQPTSEPAPMEILPALPASEPPQSGPAGAEAASDRPAAVPLEPAPDAEARKTPKPSLMEILSALSASLPPQNVSARPVAPDGLAAAKRQTAAPSAAQPDAEARKKRLSWRARRRQATALRDASFDLLAEGYTHREIADARKVSVTVVRRDIERAIRARQAETHSDHTQLQIARLTKGLLLACNRIGHGELAAIGPLVKVVTALDRYQGDSAPRLSPPSRRQGRLAAPPLALTHAPAALSEETPCVGAPIPGLESDPDEAETVLPDKPLESLDR